MTELIDESRNISNSEVTTFLSCKRMYDYAFITNLAPKETSNPLARGGLGHEAFEHYGLARIDGSSHEDALNAGTAVFERATASRDYKIDVVMETLFLWNRYMGFHNGWPNWKILGVEQRHELPITETINLVMRYDLYVQDLSTGKYLIGDYKFTYDFWSPSDHDINGQMPKYIAVMQANGLRVDGGFLEEIRTRKLGADKSADPKNLWRRSAYYPSGARKRSMLHQHVAASLEIQKHRALTDDERSNVSIPVLNKHGACKFCNFKDLCNSQLEGKTDLSVDIRSSYVQNTYGYNKQVMEELI